MSDPVPQTQADWERFLVNKGVSPHTAVHIAKTVMDERAQPQDND